MPSKLLERICAHCCEVHTKPSTAVDTAFRGKAGSALLLPCQRVRAEHCRSSKTAQHLVIYAHAALMHKPSTMLETACTEGSACHHGSMWHCRQSGTAQHTLTGMAQYTHCSDVQARHCLSNDKTIVGIVMYPKHISSPSSPTLNSSFNIFSCH